MDSPSAQRKLRERGRDDLGIIFLTTASSRSYGAKNSLNHLAPLNPLNETQLIAPRESSLGHIDGSDVFYY